MTYDFQKMVDDNVIVQQHNAIMAMRDCKPDYTAQLDARLKDLRNHLWGETKFFNEELEGA